MRLEHNAAAYHPDLALDPVICFLLPCMLLLAVFTVMSRLNLRAGIRQVLSIPRSATRPAHRATKTPQQHLALQHNDVPCVADDPHMTNGDTCHRPKRRNAVPIPRKACRQPERSGSRGRTTHIATLRHRVDHPHVPTGKDTIQDPRSEISYPFSFGGTIRSGADVAVHQKRPPDPW